MSNPDSEATTRMLSSCVMSTTLTPLKVPTIARFRCSPGAIVPSPFASHGTPS